MPSDADHLLDAIRRHEGDDTPRLAFADYLDERGTTADADRADWVRLQCKLARTPDGEPGRWDMEAREAQLWALRGREWVGDLKAHVSRVEFRRGFPWRARVTASAFAADAERWLPDTTIRHVHVGALPESVAAAEAVARSPALRVARSLQIGDSGLSPTTLNAVLRSPHLTGVRGLKFRPDALAREGLDRFLRDFAHADAFGNLQSLDVSGAWLHDVGVARLAQTTRLHRLTALNLSATHVGTLGLRHLAHAPFYPRLSRIHLSRNTFDAEGLRALFEGLREVPWDTVEALECFGTTDFRRLYDGPALAGTRVLRLTGTGMGEDGAAALASADHWRDLEWLDLSQNLLGGNGVARLASGHFPRLRQLDLRSNGVRDAGVRALLAADWSANLTALDLGRNQIGGPGVRALLQGRHLPRLERLSLAQNYIGTPTLEAIVGVLAERPALRELDLSGNHIDDRGARLLAESPKLSGVRKVVLKGNPVSAAVLLWAEGEFAGRGVGG